MISDVRFSKGTVVVATAGSNIVWVVAIVDSVSVEILPASAVLFPDSLFKGIANSIFTQFSWFGQDVEHLLISLNVTFSGLKNYRV